MARKKLLGVLKDKTDIHIKSICRKANKKLSAFARLSNDLTDAQKFIFVNSVIKSQFSYCPLLCCKIFKV